MRRLVAAMGLVFALSGMPALADEGSPPEWGAAALQLEAALKKAVVAPPWRNAQTQWRQGLADYMEFAGEKQALLLLEAHLTPSAFKPAWKTQRGAWLKLVRSTDKRSDLEAALLTLEQALAPGALAPSWAKARAGWERDLATLIQERRAAENL